MNRVTALLVSVSAVGCFTQASVPERVTAANIRSVQLGMSREEVERLLGPPPIDVEANDPEFFGPNSQTLVYFRRLPFPRQYPMLWVHLRDGEVESVYAKRHNIFDSDGLYGLDAERRWEARRFAVTFP